MLVRARLGTMLQKTSAPFERAAVICAARTPSSQPKFQKARLEAEAIKPIDRKAARHGARQPAKQARFKARATRAVLSIRQTDIAYCCTERCPQCAVPALGTRDKLARLFRYLADTSNMI